MTGKEILDDKANVNEIVKRGYQICNISPMLRKFKDLSASEIIKNCLANTVTNPTARITSTNVNVTINETGKKITYPMYSVDGTNFAQLANIKSVLSAASGYTYEIYEANGTTVATAMDVTIN